MSGLSNGDLAREFWKVASYSKLAAQEMYDRQHEVLRRFVLPYLQSDGLLLDIGCSDGEFTEVLAGDCIGGLGLDLSSSLIDKAKQRNLKGIQFVVGDVVEFEFDPAYDTVAIMGMLTYLVDYKEFNQVVEKVVAALKLGGYLVLKDSVRLDGRGDVYLNDGKYEAIYRDEADYLKAFSLKGLELVWRAPIVVSQDENQASIIYLMRKPAYLALAAPESRMRLAIFLQAPEAWANVRSIWQAAVSDVEMEVIVVLMPFLHDSYEWRRAKVGQYLQKEGVSYIPWDRLDVKEARFDAVIYTSPYDETRPAEYRFDAVRPWVRSISYVPYGIEIGGGHFDLELQYGQPVATSSDFVFARSQRLKDAYGRYCPSGNDHVVVAGYPRFDELANLRDFSVDPLLLEQIGERVPVLWNTHFAFDQKQWSTFDLLGPGIFQLFAESPNLALIFRPHPLLWGRIKTVFGFSDKDLELLKSELTALGIIIDERADHRHVFACSQALISDVGSFLMDYLLTGKPILYLENPHGLGLNEEGKELVSLFPKASSLESVELFLKALVKGENFEGHQRLMAIPKFAPLQDGMVGIRIFQKIKKSLMTVSP